MTAGVGSAENITGEWIISIHLVSVHEVATTDPQKDREAKPAV